MKLTININMDNSAFENGWADEAERCCIAAIRKLDGMKDRDDSVAVTTIRDFNGNAVGTATVED